MKQILAGLGTGLLFGGGLAIAGMTDPRVVVGFLDVAGAWNPTLVFVLAGAVITTFIGYRLVFRQNRPLWSDAFHVPRIGRVDAQLLGGAGLFGVGWGLSGYCPGPAVASVTSLQSGTLVFLAAMLIGMAGVRIGRGMRRRQLATTG